MFILNIDHYIHCVPHVIIEKEIFLKTIYKNRKLNKIYNINEQLLQITDSLSQWNEYKEELIESIEDEAYIPISVLKEEIH